MFNIILYLDNVVLSPTDEVDNDLPPVFIDRSGPFDGLQEFQRRQVFF